MMNELDSGSMYCDKNGLVDGNIPAGKPCPFAENCKMLTERCPVEGKVNQRDFSCAMARLNSLIKVRKK